MTYTLTPKTRVVIADDHPVFREGVTAALKASGDIAVVAEESGGRAALEAIRKFTPDVALLDYRMPDLDGLAVAHAVARDNLPTRIVILSASSESHVVYSALADGAHGFLTKDCDRREIVRGVLDCAKGKGVLPEQLTAGLAGEIRQRANSDSVFLSEREMQVVTKIAEGKTVPKIAAELFLAPTTVKTHVQRLYEKLGVSDRGAAVAEAMRRRIIE